MNFEDEEEKIKVTREGDYIVFKFRKAILKIDAITKKKGIEGILNTVTHEWGTGLTNLNISLDRLNVLRSEYHILNELIKIYDFEDERLFNIHYNRFDSVFDVSIPNHTLGYLLDYTK